MISVYPKGCGDSHGQMLSNNPKTVYALSRRCRSLHATYVEGLLTCLLWIQPAYFRIGGDLPLEE